MCRSSELSFRRTARTCLRIDANVLACLTAQRVCMPVTFEGRCPVRSASAVAALAFVGNALRFKLGCLNRVGRSPRGVLGLLLGFAFSLALSCFKDTLLPFSPCSFAVN